MWFADVEGGRGEDGRRMLSGGYTDLGELLAEVARLLQGDWGAGLVNIRLKLEWRLPQAMGLRPRASR
jgi:hypothetical protein